MQPLGGAAPGQGASAGCDALQKLSHKNPGKSFKLWLGSLSVGETKRVWLKVTALKYSLGLVDHPDVRAWVSHVDNFYEKKDFSAKPNNVKGYQKQNGGNLRTYTQTDVLEKELCDGKDNDCDGKVDEGGVCPKAAPDSGASAAPDSLALQPDTGTVPWPEQGLEAREDGWAQGGADLSTGELPGVVPDGPEDMSGGCSVSGTLPTWPAVVALLALLGLWRRRIFG